MRKLDWKTYLDKVYGCFLGKAVVGTMGAPFEGVKMPLAMPFDKKMIDAMLPTTIWICRLSGWTCAKRRAPISLRQICWPGSVKIATTLPVNMR